MKKKEIFVAFIIVLLLLTLLVRKLNLLDMWTFADLYPYPDNLNHKIEGLSNIWSNEGFGGLISPMFSIIRFSVILQLIFPPAIAQKIMIFLPFVVGYLSFFMFMRHFKFSITSSYITSLVYIINPTILSLFLVGEVGSMMTLAIFPLVIISLNKFLFLKEKINLKYLVVLVIIFFLLIWNLYYVFWLGVFSFLFLIFLNFRNLKNKRYCYYKNLFFKIVLLIFIIFLINLPSVIILSLVNNQKSSNEITISSQALYSYEDATFLNLIRLAGNKGSPQVKGYLDYNLLNKFTIFGIILSLFIFIPLFIKWKRKKMRLYYPAAISFLLIIILIFVVKNIPSVIDMFLLGTLRNPSKLMVTLSFFFALLVSISIQTIIQTYKKIKVPILLIFLLLLILYNYPFLQGDLGINKMKGSVYIPNDYTIEEKYYDLKQFLDSSDNKFSEFDIFYFPWERFSRNKITKIIPNYFGVGSGLSSFTNSGNGFNDLYQILEENPKDKANILSFFNIKYIIIDKKFESMYSSTNKQSGFKVKCDNLNFCWYLGDQNLFYNHLKIDKNFDLIYENDNFSIFSNTVLQKPQKIYDVNPQLLNKKINVNVINKETLVSAKLDNNLYNFNVVGDFAFSKDSIDNSYSLSLYSNGINWPHIYKIIPLEKNKLGKYRLSFNFKGYNITNLHAKLLWNDEEIKPEYYKNDKNASKADYINLYQGDLKDGKWYKLEKEFNAPKNATTVTLIIFGSQASAKTKKFNNTVTLIDNINFEFYQTESDILLPNNVSNIINYEKINPTLWKVKINSSSPYILIFNELYDPLWVVQIKKDNLEIKSEPVYGLVNGFYINKTGEYELIINYKPQKLFKYANYITISTFLFLIFYGIYYFWKKSLNLKCLLKK